MLLLEPLYDSFRDVQEAADELAEGLREHLVETALVLPLGEGSRRLADGVARRLGFERSPLEARDLERSQRVPRTVVLVAERIRRVRAVDAAIARLLHAGAERILIATPLAESSVACEVDDRADVFVCLRRAPRLVTISRWYDQWSLPVRTEATAQPPASAPMLAAL